MKITLLCLSLFLSASLFGQTSGNGVTDIDGNYYETVIIGTQEWMTKNLTVSSFSNGESIENIIDGTYWGGALNPAWCSYNNSNANDSIYGKLYNWYVINDSRNVCPSGWHVPTKSEWDTLVSDVGGNTIAGGILKETGLLNWSSPNTGATNQSGFTALPGGYRSNGSGNFIGINDYGFFWSATSDNASSSFICYLHYNNAEASVAGGNNQDGLSVRCVTSAPNSGIIEINSTKNLVQILDLMGRETTFKPNTLLIYVYDDGSTEKVFTIK